MTSLPFLPCRIVVADSVPALVMMSSPSPPWMLSTPSGFDGVVAPVAPDRVVAVAGQILSSSLVPPMTTWSVPL